MKKPIIFTLAVLALAACETPNGAGTGSGNVRGTQKPVAFTWESDDNNSGDITATSELDKGTTFRIVLPRELALNSSTIGSVLA